MENEVITELIATLEGYEKSSISAIELEKFTQAIDELNDVFTSLTNDVERVRVANIKKTYCRIALEKMAKSDKSDDKLLVLYIRLFINHLNSEFQEIKANQPLLLKGWNDYLDQWQEIASFADSAVNVDGLKIGEFRELS
jgi:hypothetical protein